MSLITQMLLAILSGAQDILFDVVFAPLLGMLHAALVVIPGGGVVIQVLDRWFEKASTVWPPSGGGK